MSTSVLETGRVVLPSFDEIVVDAHLRLEPLAAEDAAEWYRQVIANQNDLTRVFGFADDLTLDKAESYCRGWERHRQSGLAVEYKVLDGGEYAGSVGLAPDRKRDMTPSMFYWIAQAKRGHGLAARAATAVRDTVFDAGLPMIELAIRPANNAPSRRVARAIGAGPERPLSIAGRGKRHLPTALASLLENEVWVVYNPEMQRG